MELCDLNLHFYIQKDFPFSFSQAEKSNAVPVSLSIEDRLLCIRKVMVDIVAGLSYIHAKNEVHRDLKPRNGDSLRVTLIISSVSSSRECVEDRRFWSDS